jgi:hypothetical protein
MRKSQFAGLIAGLSLAFSVPLASGAVIVTDPTITDVVPGIATFQTHGDDMTGMTVTMNFATGSETAVWGALGPDAGGAFGVFGTGWSIQLIGDTFTADWNVALGTDLLLLSMEFDGRPGLTVFDKTEPSFGTPGSAQGRDFVSSLADDALVVATYSRQVAVGLDDPVGDLWHVLFVDFAALDGVRGQFTFLQDTDNDIRRQQVPEPGTLGLFGLGVAALGLALRRRRPR